MKSFRGWKTERKCIMQNTTTLNFYCTERPPDRGALFLFIYYYARWQPDIQLYKHDTAIQKLKKHKNTEILESQVHRHGKWIPNQFWTELFDSFGESTLYRLPTATKAWCIRRDIDCRTTDSEQYIFSKTVICAGVTKMVLTVYGKNTVMV